MSAFSVNNISSPTESHLPTSSGLWTEKPVKSVLKNRKIAEIGELSLVLQPEKEENGPFDVSLNSYENFLKFYELSICFMIFCLT